MKPITIFVTVLLLLACQYFVFRYSQFGSSSAFVDYFRGSSIRIGGPANDAAIYFQLIMNLAGSFGFETRDGGQSFCQSEFQQTLRKATAHSTGRNDTRLYFWEDYIPKESIMYKVNETINQNKIPKILHFTAPSRCLTSPFWTNIQRWKKMLPEYAIFLHDTAAQERHFERVRSIPNHPLGLIVSMIRPCLKASGATVSDIWRYSFLWEFGGMYVDLDDAPTKNLAKSLGEAVQKHTTIDAILLATSPHVVSQSFMLTSPQHPLLQMALLQVLSNLLDLSDIGQQYIPYTTGPHAWQSAYAAFMRLPQTGRQRVFRKDTRLVGVGNWSVTLLPNYNEPHNESESPLLLNATAISGEDKSAYYSLVKGVDYQRQIGDARREGIQQSCLERQWLTGTTTHIAGEHSTR